VRVSSIPRMSWKLAVDSPAMLAGMVKPLRGWIGYPKSGGNEASPDLTAVSSVMRATSEPTRRKLGSLPMSRVASKTTRFDPQLWRTMSEKVKGFPT
jgi:hypothetical protein